jgi:hypothetical protein
VLRASLLNNQARWKRANTEGEEGREGLEGEGGRETEGEQGSRISFTLVGVACWATLLGRRMQFVLVSTCTLLPRQNSCPRFELQAYFPRNVIVHGCSPLSTEAACLPMLAAVTVTPHETADEPQEGAASPPFSSSSSLPLLPPPLPLLPPPLPHFQDFGVRSSWTGPANPVASG